MASKAETLLKDYKAKRDFTKTQEPSGTGSADGKGYRFVVQKHDATRLHYDFRIELDGVLKSWAVTKGPSDNPEDKRLAVRVEDHPLDYGSFEGTIPEGEYGGGTVMLWDEGTWEPLGDPHAALDGGDLKMKLNGHRMKGEWVLVHMKGRDSKRKSGSPRENWLLIKHRDDYAKDKETLVGRFTKSVSTGRDFDGIANGLKSKKPTETPDEAVWHSDKEKAVDHPAPARPKAKGKLGPPTFRPPQLATLVTDIPEGSEWVFEMKYDGYRCIAAISGEAVQLFTRTGKDWTTQFQAIVPPLSRITKGTALIDGELCAFDDKGRTDFSTLKDHLSTGGPLTYFAFDLLELDGKELTKAPLTERKTKLEKLLGKIDSSSLVQFSSHVIGNGQKVFDAVSREGHEGIIAKQASAPYRSERTRSWLKIKASKRQEFVIAGWSPSTRKKTFASLLIGTWEDGKLIYRGRVGTGFTVDSADALQRRLDTSCRSTSPFANVPRSIAKGAKWVRPELVAEIGYTEFTPDGILRHPSFLGLREDKPAADVASDNPADPKAAAAPLSRKAGIDAAEAAGVRLTSPDRVVYPGQGVTKADLVAYYAAVAEVMLPYIQNRPLSLLRCPQGRAKYCFFQKHDTGGFPDAMKSLLIAEKDGEKEDYFYIDGLEGLIAGTQMNVLEWHLWGSRIKDVEKPERIIFDIDPDEGLGFEHVRSAAVRIRNALEDVGLESYPLVSGGKGVHVIAPLRPQAGWPEVKAFCKQLALDLANAEPERFVATMSKAKRKGRLFIDYLRNERGSTAIAPWSSRSREGAPVAVPVSWDQLKDVRAANQFDLAEAAVRSGHPDPWKGYLTSKQTITGRMLAQLKRP